MRDHADETPQAELLRLVRDLSARETPKACDDRHAEALSPKAIVGAFKAHPIVQVVMWLGLAAGGAVVGFVGYTWQLADKADGRAAVLEVEQRQFREVVQELRGLPMQVRILDHKVGLLRDGGS